MDRMLKLPEIAEALRLSRGTVSKMLAKGQIPEARKIGNTWRVPESAFAEFVRPAVAATPARPRASTAVRARIKAKHGV